MLTRKEELQLVSDLTIEERSRRINIAIEMQKGDPDLLLTELIDFKSKDFKISKRKLLIELVNAENIFEKTGVKPEPYSIYSYTYQWFSFYIHKMKLMNKFPKSLLLLNEKDWNSFKPSKIKLVSFLKNKSNNLNIKTRMLFTKLIQYFYDELTDTKKIEKEDDIHFYNIYQVFKYYVKDLVLLNPFEDIFGEVMLEISSLDKKNLGQCMSPQDLSSTISALINAGNKNYSKQQTNIADISGCGTGSLILSLMKNQRDNTNKLSIYINDIDLEMMQITYIQCYLQAECHLKAEEIIIIAHNCDLIFGYNNSPAKCKTTLTKNK